MAIEISWSRVATIPLADAVTSGVANIGGRLVTVVGTGTGTPLRGEIWFSDDNGATWTKGSDLALFSREGIGGSSPSDLGCGLLCYTPGNWLHPEDGDYFSSGDAGGLLRYHAKDVLPGIPVFLLTGFALFGSPCLKSRKDLSDEIKFGIWPGGFLYEIFGVTAVGPLLLELSASGATSITSAFIRHQLDPTGVPYATVNQDGSISWLWVTFPPRVGVTGGTPSDLFTEGDFFFMLSTMDGIIWRPHGDNQRHLTDARASTNFGNSYNYFTQAFFCSDGTLLCGVNVSGLSPCLFRSTADGNPGTMHEIVMPGNFFNYVPQGAKGSFLFSGLFVMTHCFCELDDGTILCGGGAPTMTVPGEGVGVPAGSQAGSTSYHYPLVWKSTDKGLTWQNISTNIADFGTRLPLGSAEVWESRILLALGGQAAVLITAVDGVPDNSSWTPFYITEDGENFSKSMPLVREGFLEVEYTPAAQVFYPIQATFANDGSIVVVMTDWASRVEIWRGVLDAGSPHLAVGFLEQKASGTGFDLGAIPQQELIRG